MTETKSLSRRRMTVSRKTRELVMGALTAAVYVVLTWLSSAFGLAYAGVQLRLSEALCVLPAFTPSAVIGLTVGCALSNITSPFGLVDVVCGSAATLIAALLARAISRSHNRAARWLIPLPAVAVNALVVGAEVAAFSGEAFAPVFALTCLQVGVGQLLACYGLGMPLYFAVKKHMSALTDSR